VAGHVFAQPAHAALGGLHKAQQAADQRGLAHAVAPEQRRHLPGAHLERDAEQHLARTVGGFDTLHVEQGFAHAISSPR
jgi:hypothetical protein